MKGIKLVLVFFTVCVFALCVERMAHIVLQGAEQGEVCLLPDETVPMDEHVLGNTINDPATLSGKLSDFNKYLSEVLRSLPFDVPPASNYISERNSFQYCRIRKALDVYHKGRYQSAVQLDNKNIVLFNEVSTGQRYAYPQDYYIVSLNKIRC